MGYDFCMKNNNRRVILNRFFEELDDETKWTRARVEAQIYSAVILAIQMDKNDKTRQHMLATWPAECSVRYEWFESVIADVKLPPNIAPFDNTHNNFYNVLVHWLDSVDSVTDRKLLILHSIGLSMNKLSKKTGLLRQTASRHYTNAIDALVWKLNH